MAGFFYGDNVVDDKNPERRNLSLASLSFVAYFWGGGSLVADNVTLQFISLKFSRPEVLALLAWVTLFWFLYRYWLLNRNKFHDSYAVEILSRVNREDANQYVAKALGNKAAEDSEEGLHIDKIYWSGLHMRADCVWALKVGRNTDTGRISSRTGADPKRSQEVVFDGIGGWRTAIVINSRVFALTEGFSSYLVPYVLFFIALLSALVSLFLM
ncbi:hypothetical protein LV476_04310 [Guyparkeria hydrothermalis]|uniref:hypothetical protein n=1 Tax=Guyparkeria hydrothermalis TaxID=923 RepID=UPI0020217618|nr:hypothetical protein [Guyparkeria hydrothermalis]MCL7744176.1 hypothetical protein [Guyparkeria hydrothermalis]